MTKSGLALQARVSRRFALLRVRKSKQSFRHQKETTGITAFALSLKKDRLSLQSMVDSIE